MSGADIAVNITLVLHFFSLGFLCLYGAHCYRVVWLHVRHKKTMLARDAEILNAWNPRDDELPVVTVQLPLYNEEFVVTRLIENIVQLDYPKDRLEIQILDDSIDATTQIATDLAERFRREGFDITLYHRPERTGFKAGNLKEGNEIARGEFIVIFDADFMPHPDFLRKTLPFFDDPKMAMVQTLWSHLNRDYSPLTIAQSVGLDGTNYVTQSARCWSNLMVHFQGTGGIWRRSAIDDAGGWQADTLTEDLDLSYRAQIKGWKAKFLPQVFCPGEIPATISAAKSQQHRWSKGGLETAYKLIPAILKSDLPRVTKTEAVFHLVTYLIHPCILVLALDWPLQVWFDKELIVLTNPLIGALTLALALFGPATQFLYAQREIYPKSERRLRHFIFLIIYGTGIAINNTKAIFEALLKIKSGFVRTPKFGLGYGSNTIVKKAYRAKLGGLVIVESLIAVYCLFGVTVMLFRDSTLINPFLFLATIGICLVAGQTIWEQIAQRRASQKALLQQEASAAAEQA